MSLNDIQKAQENFKAIKAAYKACPKDKPHQKASLGMSLNRARATLNVFEGRTLPGPVVFR